MNLRRSQERLEFLGYQISLAPVRDDRRRCYRRMEPSHKAMEREVDRIWQMTCTNKDGNRCQSSSAEANSE